MNNIKALIAALLFFIFSSPTLAVDFEFPPYLEQQYQILGSMPPLPKTTESLATPSQFYKNYQKSVIQASTDQQRASLAVTAIHYWRHFGQITLLKSKTPDKAGVFRYRVITEQLDGNYQILFIGDTDLQYKLLEDLLSHQSISIQPAVTTNLSYGIFNKREEDASEEDDDYRSFDAWYDWLDDWGQDLDGWHIDVFDIDGDYEEWCGSYRDSYGRTHTAHCAWWGPES